MKSHVEQNPFLLERLGVWIGSCFTSTARSFNLNRRVNRWAPAPLTFVFCFFLCVILIHVSMREPERAPAQRSCATQRICPAAPRWCRPGYWTHLCLILSRIKFKAFLLRLLDFIGDFFFFTSLSLSLHRWSFCSQWQIRGMRIDAGGTTCSDKGGWLPVCGCLQPRCDALLPFFFFFLALRSAERPSFALLFFFAHLELTQVYWNNVSSSVIDYKMICGCEYLKGSWIMQAVL